MLRRRSASARRPRRRRAGEDDGDRGQHQAVDAARPRAGARRPRSTWSTAASRNAGGSMASPRRSTTGWWSSCTPWSAASGPPPPEELTELIGVAGAMTPTGDPVDPVDAVAEAELLAAQPPLLEHPGALAAIRDRIPSRGRLLVIDDDPTGTQSVHGVPVLTFVGAGGPRGRVARTPALCSCSPTRARCRSARRPR